MMCFRTWPRLRLIRPEWSEISHSRLVGKVLGYRATVMYIWDKFVAICGSSATLRGLTNDVIVAAMENIGPGYPGEDTPKCKRVVDTF